MRAALKAIRAHIWNASDIKATSTYLCNQTHRQRKLCKQKTISTSLGKELCYYIGQRSRQRKMKVWQRCWRHSDLYVLATAGIQMITSMASKALSWHYVWFNSKVLSRFWVGCASAVVGKRAPSIFRWKRAQSSIINDLWGKAPPCPKAERKKNASKCRICTEAVKRTTNPILLGTSQ